jgi:hypothetical protein
VKGVVPDDVDVSRPNSLSDNSLGSRKWVDGSSLLDSLFGVSACQNKTDGPLERMRVKLSVLVRAMKAVHVE